MTELDTIRRAKMYLDKLANGVDPITDREVPQDSVLNDVRLSRCFFFVSDVLRQVVENGGVTKPKQEKKQPFSLDAEEAVRVPVSPCPLLLSHLCRAVSEAVKHENQKDLRPQIVSEWLVEKGFLRVEELGGKARKRVTKDGERIGIQEERREGQYGGYFALLYDTPAQQFILDNLPDILAQDG